MPGLLLPISLLLLAFSLLFGVRLLLLLRDHDDLVVGVVAVMVICSGVVCGDGSGDNYGNYSVVHQVWC